MSDELGLRKGVECSSKGEVLGVGLILYASSHILIFYASDLRSGKTLEITA